MQEELVVLGYIVRNFIFPAFASIVVRHNSKPAIIFPGNREIQQIDGIDSEDELQKKSANYIPLQHGHNATFVLGRDIAFAFNKEEIALLPARDLRRLLLSLALNEEDDAAQKLYCECAREIRF